MDLQTKVSEPLWAAIETAYRSRNFKAAILDAIYFLSDAVREKTGLESDGVALVGEAFGGKNPRLRVNQLQTESDWSVQKGFSNLLIGLYQSVRNPRSHGTHSDTEQDADAIILFINYLLGVIGASKGAFSKNEFLERVFDQSFVEKNRYAELLVEEIPARHRLDVMIEVYRRREKGEGNKLALFTKALIVSLDEADTTRFVDVVSDDLRKTEGDTSVRFAYQILPRDIWARMDETARLRAENRFLQSIRDGEYIVASKKCTKGALGTWCSRLIETSSLKEDFISAIFQKLEAAKRTEQDYVLTFLAYPLLRILDKMEDKAFAEIAVAIINQYVKTGDKRFHDLAGMALNISSFWRDSLKQEYDNFQEAQTTQDSEDLPS